MGKSGGATELPRLIGHAGIVNRTLAVNQSMNA